MRRRRRHQAVWVLRAAVEGLKILLFLLFDFFKFLFFCLLIGLDFFFFENMKTDEILVLEKANMISIYLLKEDLYYRTYELNENEKVANGKFRLTNNK